MSDRCVYCVISRHSCAGRNPENWAPGRMENQTPVEGYELARQVCRDLRAGNSEALMTPDRPVKVLPAVSKAINNSKKHFLRKIIRMPDFSLTSIYSKIIAALATACLALIIYNYGLRDPQPFEALQKTTDRSAPPSTKTTTPKEGQPVVNNINKPSNNHFSINSMTISENRRIDPFENPFEKGASTSTVMKKRAKRVPLTPLEKLDLSQLKLVGIIFSARGNKAMVEDATGKGFVLNEGTYVGRNSGKVTKILREKVIIEEEIEDIHGKIVIMTREMIINKR